METDYLIIGSGAMGMAFADVILTETDATVTLVDRRAKPGGHWNDAYPFVRLHQPSSFYGVNSRPLGQDAIDAVGWNKGLYELASGSELVAYYDHVLNQQFLPTGRVRYLPMSDYRGDGRVTSLVSGRDTEIEVTTKTVDATYMNVSVPSTHPPSYEVGDGARCVPLNDLVRTTEPADGYVIIGAGKTGADACLWLLANGVEPDSISWVMPRDSWYLDRADIQPGALAENRVARFASQTAQVGEATDLADLFDRLERGGHLLRLDPDVEPTMYRCSTVTVAELEQLKRINNIIRLGRVRRIDDTTIELDGGTVPTTTGTLHVDCSADGLARRPVRPIFDGDSITLQTVRHCQQVFSGALIAHVEAAYDDDGVRNELCTVVPHPDRAADWLRTWIGSNLNLGRWRSDPALAAWLGAARLDAFSSAEEPTEAQRAAAAEFAPVVAQAMANAHRILAEAADG